VIVMIMNDLKDVFLQSLKYAQLKIITCDVVNQVISNFEVNVDTKFARYCFIVEINSYNDIVCLFL